MSSLISLTTPTKAIVLTDTLAVVGDKPFRFTTKAQIVPHLNIIIVGTGVGGFADTWALFVNTESNATGIDTLDPNCVTLLPQMWGLFRKQRGIANERTVTLYHFGFSEHINKIKTFIYRSETGFSSEEIGYGYITKPPIDIGSQYTLPRDAKLLMDDQRRVQSQLPKQKRVYMAVGFKFTL